MRRSDFLKRLGLGVLAAPVLAEALEEPFPVKSWYGGWPEDLEPKDVSWLEPHPVHGDAFTWRNGTLTINRPHGRITGVSGTTLTVDWS
jgi:hypothetical protein